MAEHDSHNELGEESEKNSLLAEALRNGGKLQICRVPSKNRPKKERSNWGAFFGATEEEEEPDIEITTEPASLQAMRQEARERKKQQLENGNINNLSKKKRGRRKVRRSNTFDANTIKKSAGLEFNPQPMRALSPTRVAMANKGPLAPVPLARARSAEQPPGLFPNYFEAMEQRHSEPAIKSRSYSEHEETIKRLTIQDDDIQKILEDPAAFAKLQKVLRKHGAVTNEVLRQVLPLYVKHQIHSQEEKQRHSASKKRSSGESRKGGEDGAPTPPREE